MPRPNNGLKNVMPLTFWPSLIQWPSALINRWGCRPLLRFRTAPPRRPGQCLTAGGGTFWSCPLASGQGQWSPRKICTSCRNCPSAPYRCFHWNQAKDKRKIKFTGKYMLNKWIKIYIYCKFLILHENLIPRFNRFPSNRENNNSRMMNFYHSFM